MPILLTDLNYERATRTLVLVAIRQSSSIVEASRLLGLHRHSLARKVKRWGWDPKAIREGTVDDDFDLLSSWGAMKS